MGKWKIDADGFYLYESVQYRPFYNYLSNDNYGLKISHLGDGYSSTLKEPRVIVSNYDFWTPVKGRFLYVVDGKNIWNPSFSPTNTKLNKYECKHAPGYTQYISVKNELMVQQTIFLPKKGSYEIMSILVENLSKKEKKVQLFTESEFLLYNSLEVDPVYYSWFTDTKLRNEKTIIYYKLDENPTVGFYKSLTKVSGFDSSLKEFLGDGNIQLPEVVKKKKSHNSRSGGDPYIGSFQFKTSLRPGQKKEFAVFMGMGLKDLHTVDKKYKSIFDVHKEFNAVKSLWQKKIFKKEIANLGNNIFANYLRTFFPYQIYQQSEGLVRGAYRGYRDVAQDSIGLSYFDKKGAREIILDMCTKEFETGRCLRQWNTGGGFNDERDFRDLPIWIAVAVHKYIENTGDHSILDVKVPYFDSKKSGSVYQHMIKGMEYVLRYGKHNLLKIGEGDWNDALSGLGENGESLWLSEFAYYGLSKIDELNNKYRRSCSIDIQKENNKLYKGVMKHWTGKWFSRGFTDKGDLIGGKERIFLLPQAWFVISGMYKRDKQKAEIAIQNMIRKLDNENGLLLCYPAFDKYDSKVGRLSSLAPGMAENYAVYNHASAFAVLALFQLGYKKEADKYLKKLLPIYKDIEKTKIEPFVFVNYYNGGYYPSKKGYGGIPWLTSTVSWFAVILFDEIIKKSNI